MQNIITKLHDNSHLTSITFHQTSNATLLFCNHLLFTPGRTAPYPPTLLDSCKPNSSTLVSNPQGTCIGYHFRIRDYETLLKSMTLFDLSHLYIGRRRSDQRTQLMCRIPTLELQLLRRQGIGRYNIIEHRWDRVETALLNTMHDCNFVICYLKRKS